MPAQTARATTKADLVIVDKEARTLRLYKGDAVLKSYRVALGRNPKGHKQEEGIAERPKAVT